MREDDSDRVSRQTTEAWKRLKKDRNWADWMVVGEGLVLWREEAMKQARTNAPMGRAYNEAFGTRLTRYKLDDMDGGDRHRLFEVMDNRPAIEAYRQTLSLRDRLRLNHPSTVLRHFKAYQAKNSPEGAADRADAAALRSIPDQTPKMTPFEAHDPEALALLNAKVAEKVDDPEEWDLAEALKVWFEQATDADRKAFTECISDKSHANKGYPRPIVEKFGDGKWHSLPVIAKHLNAPESEVEASLGGMLKHGWGDAKTEIKKVGTVKHYRFFKNERMISSTELTEKLAPILEGLKKEGRKNQVTMSVMTVAVLASQLDKLLTELTSGG
jgi:hypothetical protein